jgi:hypothetical protein
MRALIGANTQVCEYVGLWNLARDLWNNFFPYSVK